MNYSEALKLMKEGAKVKLPSWGGYWFWDHEKKTIIIHTKDGEEFDIRETDRVEYTTLNVASEDWIIADDSNCPELGGEALFGFEEALKYIKRGFKMCRKNWNAKDQYIYYMDLYMNEQCKVEENPCMVGTFYPFLVIKTNYNGIVPWLASQTDLLANDWCFAE